MKKRGAKSFTIRSAGALFLLSAVFELASLGSAIPLFGAIRGGSAAAAYHLVYVVLFAFIGSGLWAAKPWAFSAVLWGALVYTLDKALLLMDRPSMEAYLLLQLGELGDITQIIDLPSLLQVMTVASLLSVACWWGFAAYLYIRRDYFSSEGKDR